MRIWHLMAGVLTVAVMSALIARAPELGTLAVMDVVVFPCAFLLVRNDGRVRTLWAGVQRRSELMPGLRRGIVLLAGGSIAFVYVTLTSLVMSAAVLLATTTGVFAVGAGVAEIVRRFHGAM